MTDTDVDVQTLAQRIADRGQDALVARIRTAYADAAAAHADLISLDHERIEAMVQAAAEHADGLQWRRALAGVAAGELGVSVTEALSHPAVARAQALVGAPSYEQSLAELIARPVPPPSSEAPASAPSTAPAASAPSTAPATEAGRGNASQAETGNASPAETGSATQAGIDNGAIAAAEPAQALPEPEPPVPEPEPEPEPGPPMPEPPMPEPPHPGRSVSAADSELPPTVEHQTLPDAEPTTGSADELETVQADDVVLELLPEPDPIEYETEVYDVEASFAEEQASPTAEPEPFSAAASGRFGEQPTAVAAPEVAPHPDTPPQADTDPVPDAAKPAEPGPETGYQEEEHLELVIPAIHQGGVANLPTKREGLGVRLSADGLDILQGERDIIGRLAWDEIETLEVPNMRSRRRRSEPRARLLVRTPHGDASFDVPGISADELREQVQPLMQLYGRH